MDRQGKEQHLLCSQMVTLQVQPKSGRLRKLAANLEEIWPSGACLQTDGRIPRLSRVRFACGGFEGRGKIVTRTFLKGLGYFVEVRFDRRCRWSEAHYRPEHLLNPLILLANRVFETTPRVRLISTVWLKAQPAEP